MEEEQKSAFSANRRKKSERLSSGRNSFIKKNIEAVQNKHQTGEINKSAEAKAEVSDI